MGSVDVFVNAVMLCLLQCNLSQGERCLAGPYHLNASRPGGTGFVACLKYKRDACCSDELTSIVKANPKALYNFTWNHCRQMSKKCMRFLVDEECFYQCDPSLVRYQRAGQRDAVRAVPVCSGYCDQWFDACKDDLTCVENWETGFAKVGHHFACPNTSKCLTFKEIYKDGAGLCNKMWGMSFYYENGSQTCYEMGGQKQKARGIGVTWQPAFALLGTVILLSWAVWPLT